MIARAAVTLLAAVLVLLGGCSLMNPLTEVRVDATDRINPDGSDRASPLVVQVFELSDGDRFEDADFYDLYDDPEEVLGDELISVREIVLKPSEQWETSLDLDDGTRYLGALGAFRNIEKADWRVLEAVDPNDGRPVDITVDGLELKRTGK